MRMLPIDMQELNENTYSRKQIDAKIREEILANPEMVKKINQGIFLIQEWMSQDYYPSKNERLKQLKELDLEQVVTDIFIGVSYCQTPELFRSITAQLAGRLGFSDRVAAITTVAELTAILCETDAYDIIKQSREDSLMIQSNIPLSHELVEFILNSAYLPPMVSAPRELKKNYQSGYLTFNDSLILGTGNHHEGDICLDVLNSKNAVALKLDTEFLSTVEEEPTFTLDTSEKRQNWNKFKQDSYHFYHLMVAQGNEFYLTHKVDKRLRIYAQGYHITTQGSPFKKASIELYNEELVEGVPNQGEKLYTVIAGKYEGHGDENIKFISHPMVLDAALELAQQYEDYPFCYLEEA